jgi:hypothetical protein
VNASLVVSRDMAWKICDRLAQVKGEIQLGRTEKAQATIDKLVAFVNSKIETPEDAEARARREHSK